MAGLAVLEKGSALTAGGPKPEVRRWASSGKRTEQPVGGHGFKRKGAYLHRR